MRAPRLAALFVAAAALSCSPKGTPPSSGTGAGPGGGGAGELHGDEVGGSSASSAPTGSASSGGTAGVPGAKPEAIDGKLPAAPKAPKFARHSECPATGCNLKNLVPDDAKPSADDKSPIFMWEEVIPRKVMLNFPKHAGVDIYGLLLEGEVSVMADDIKEKQKRIWPWIAFRAPGAGVNLYAKEPTHIVLVVVATAKDTSAAQAIEAMQKPGSVMWAKRSSPVTAVDTSGQPDVAWGGGAYHVHYGFEGDGLSASLEVLLTSKNAPIAEHIHDKEWEAIAVIDGEGTLFKKNGDVKVGPGAMFSIPPGVPHGVKPAGTVPLLAIQMYAPPGPEQRFKKLAEAK